LTYSQTPNMLEIKKFIKMKMIYHLIFEKLIIFCITFLIEVKFHYCLQKSPSGPFWVSWNGKTG